MPGLRGLVSERDVVEGAAAADPHVLVAGRQQGLPHQHPVPILGFLDPHRAKTIQTIGKRTREPRGHVLHDHHPGRVRG